METDGRIRSKDIGTGEVNSRALDNIRSSNYNGSHTDPELDPGSAGWQILKSGFAVFNDAVFRGTVNAARIVSAIIESGVVRLTSGGKIELGGDPETGTPATATLSETGIVVGPTSLTASGVQVGTDVVIDSTGLQVIGGYVTPSLTTRGVDTATNVSLSTTDQTVCSVAVTPPSWAQTMHLEGHLIAFISENTAQKNLSTAFRVGAGSNFSGVTQTAPNGTTQTLTNFTSATETLTGVSLPTSFTINARASVNSGTNSTNSFFLLVTAEFGRS